MAVDWLEEEGVIQQKISEDFRRFQKISEDFRRYQKITKDLRRFQEIALVQR